MIAKDCCTGCGACAAICPSKSITMEQDTLGRMVPRVDKRRCTNCNLCVRICPQNQPPEFAYPLECCVAWSKNPEDLIQSASGGMGITFAREMMAKGWAVFGCDYSETAELKHFCLQNTDCLNKIRGSKYSHSDMGGCYAEIKQLLQLGRSVLFVGTPCQIAGLRKYLRMNYENLVTVDLVCHGAPPNAYLQKHLKELGIVAPIDRITFRGEYDKKLTVWKDNQIVYQKEATADPYFAAFYEDMISYDSCYTCQYAQAKRISDITIGDFWGLGKLNEIDAKSGRPSLILMNTSKGISFFRNLSECVFWEKRDVAEGINGNGRLIKPPGKNLSAKVFQGMYRTRCFSFRRCVYTYYHIQGLRYRAQRIKSVLSRKR